MTKLRMTEGKERYQVPVGRYKMRYLGSRVDNHPEFGPGLRWQMEVAEGPLAGKIGSRTTSTEPTLRNACGRMLQMLTGGIAALHQEFDDAKFIGRLYWVMIEPNSTGTGTRIGSFMPIDDVAPTNGTPPPAPASPSTPPSPPPSATRAPTASTSPATPSTSAPSSPAASTPPPPPAAPAKLTEDEVAERARLAANYWVVLPTAPPGAQPAEMTGDQLGIEVDKCPSEQDANGIRVMRHDQSGGWVKPSDLGFGWGPF
jgi:hypothetical protein